jgi:hypothetical protein
MIDKTCLGHVLRRSTSTEYFLLRVIPHYAVNVLSLPLVHLIQ